MHLDNWDDLRFVLAVARHGTMSAAARHLNTNVATVSRRLDRLGHALAVPLFEKRGGGLVATGAATDLARVAETLEQTLRARIADIRTGTPEEPLPFELAAPPAVHRRFVLPRAQALARHLPHVALTMTDKIATQGLGQADIQIRVGRPDAGRLRVRRFRDYALRVYLPRGAPLGPDWIGLTRRHAEADTLRELHSDAAPLPRCRVEDMPMALEMAMATGLPTLLPDFLVGPNTTMVAADLPGRIPGELWIAWHETRHGDPTLRALVDWLCLPTEQGRNLSTAES